MKRNATIIVGLLFLIATFFLSLYFSVGNPNMNSLNANKDVLSTDTRVDNRMRIAIRVPNLEVYYALNSYRLKETGNIKFIMYAGIDVIEQLVKAGATTGFNPVELGVLVGCSENTLQRIQKEIVKYRTYNVKYIIHDCERGDDRLWLLPDVVKIADSVKDVVNNKSYNFKWVFGMQHGYLEYKAGSGGGDQSVCIDPRDVSSCDISASFAGQVWRRYDSNDIATIFGESGAQQTPSAFETNNKQWINYAVNTQGVGWWGISGLVDKDKDNKVDLNPATVITIADRARAMGARAFGVIWVGRSVNELFGPATEMDVFLTNFSAR